MAQSVTGILTSGQPKAHEFRDRNDASAFRSAVWRKVVIVNPRRPQIAAG
jgi:hypothetical protein